MHYIDRTHKRSLAVAFPHGYAFRQPRDECPRLVSVALDGFEVLFGAGEDDISDLLGLLEPAEDDEDKALRAAWSDELVIPDSPEPTQKSPPEAPRSKKVVRAQQRCKQQARTPRSKTTTRLSGKKRQNSQDSSEERHDTGKTRTYTARKVRFDAGYAALLRSSNACYLCCSTLQDEIKALLKELPALEAYVSHLKHQAAGASSDINSTQKQQLVNSCLRDTAFTQQLAMAQVESALSNFSVSGFFGVASFRSYVLTLLLFDSCLKAQQEKVVPLDAYVHLRKKKQQRLEALLDAKAQVLRDARRFMKDRTAHTDFSVPSSETHSYVSPSGHHCVRQFVVMPLESISDACQVFETLKQRLLELEAKFSEATGEMTSCDEDVFEKPGVSQHHFLRDTSTGYRVQSNTATFAEFEDRSGEFGDSHECGMIAMNAISADELYPYCPDAYLRQDVSTVLMVRSYKRQLPSSGGKPQFRVEVALVRASLVTLHKTTLRVSRQDMHDTIEDLARRGDMLFSSVRAAFAPRRGLSAMKRMKLSL